MMKKFEELTVSINDSDVKNDNQPVFLKAFEETEDILGALNNEDFEDDLLEGIEESVCLMGPPPIALI